MGQHLKDLKDPVMEGVLVETENMLARGRMDLPLSLCFAAVRGDDLLLHQLLKRGLDPNESDNNGRTALVCENLFAFDFPLFCYPFLHLVDKFNSEFIVKSMSNAISLQIDLLK